MGQFVFLLHDDEAGWAAMSAAEQGEVIGRHGAYVEALKNAGAFVYGAPLGPSGEGKLVNGSGVQDGPFADTKEQVGGLYVIEAADEAAALDWAKRCPAAEYGRVEVRAVPDYGG